MDKYAYESLKDPKSEIRLLELQPGTGDDTIRILLSPKSLNNFPEYEAISYCWGEAKDRQAIICDDQTLNVTVSIFNALHRLRYAHRPRTLWADAICINQDDEDDDSKSEKSNQILLMSRIYSQARRVLIWLGSDDMDVEGVDKSIAYALSLFPPIPMDAVGSQETLRLILGDVLGDAKALQKQGKPNFLDHDWRTLCRLLARPWFTRKWVVQETCLAGSALVVCGKIEFPWNNLETLGVTLLMSDAVRMLSGDSGLVSKREPDLDLTASLALQNINTIAMMRQFRHQGNLLDAVIVTAEFNCFDLRDHIYALLTIPSIRNSILPDYSLGVNEVYTNFAIAMLVNEGNLKALGLAPGRTHLSRPMIRQPTHLKDLPSWVPNLSAGGGASTTLCNYSVFPRVYDAGGSKTPEVRVSNDKRLLYCQGRIVDTVQTLVSMDIHQAKYNREEWESFLPLFSNNEKLLKNHIFRRQWLLKSKDFIFPDKKDLTAEQWLTFGRVMTCLQVDKLKALPSETLRAFEVFFTQTINLIDRRAIDPKKELLETQHSLLLETSLMSIAQDRRLCQTEQGRFAQVPRTTQEGDVFAVLLGGEAPFVLRPKGDEVTERYELVGQAYLDGMMHRESLEDNNYQTKEIVIQ